MQANEAAITQKSLRTENDNISDAYYDKMKTLPKTVRKQKASVEKLRNKKSHPNRNKATQYYTYTFMVLS